jgi:hypothetical protein
MSIGVRKEYVVVIYYELIKRELWRRPIYECRWDASLKTKAEGSTRLTYTVARGWRVWWIQKNVRSDFITAEYKKARASGEMSAYNYDDQKAGKWRQFICNWIKKRREPRANNVTVKLWRARKTDKPGGIKGLDDKSIGMEMLMTETVVKIKPTDPLILPRHVSRRKRKWPDSSRYVRSLKPILHGEHPGIKDEESHH